MLLVCFGGAIGACIDDPSVRIDTVVSGLNNPVGLLVQADGVLLVAESAAGRVVAVDGDGNISTFADGFAPGSFFPYDIGPLALAELDDGTIVVGEGGRSTNQERISFFDTGGSPLADRTLVPVRGANIAALAIHPVTGDLYAASAGSNVIHRASTIEGGRFADPVEFVPDTTAPPIGLAAPAGLAFEATGDLLVALSGFDGSGIVRLSTEPDAESVLVDRLYETSDVVTAVVLRQSDDRIFFTEAALSSNVLGPGRVARLIEAAHGDVTAESLADGLLAPSALAVGADGTLFVASIGDAPNVGRGAVLAVRVLGDVRAD